MTVSTAIEGEFPGGHEELLCTHTDAGSTGRRKRVYRPRSGKEAEVQREICVGVGNASDVHGHRGSNRCGRS